jgi:hypothetical protein
MGEGGWGFGGPQPQSAKRQLRRSSPPPPSQNAVYQPDRVLCQLSSKYRSRSRGHAGWLGRHTGWGWGRRGGRGVRARGGTHTPVANMISEASKLSMCAWLLYCAGVRGCGGAGVRGCWGAGGWGGRRRPWYTPPHNTNLHNGDPAELGHNTRHLGRVKSAHTSMSTHTTHVAGEGRSRVAGPKQQGKHHTSGITPAA